MEHVLNWLWQGCVVALATSLTLRLLQRSRANARYALCWIALVVLIALPVVPSTGLAGPAFAPVVAGAPIVAVPTTWWTSTAIVMTLWAIWTAVCAVRLVRGLLAMRRLIASSRAFPASLESRLINWNRVRTRRRPTRLVLAGGVRAAAVVGCGSPVIAVAPALLQRLSVDALDAVIVHEWAHVQRRDDLLNLAQRAVGAVAGWHPGVWWLERQLRIEREAACDEIAVEITGSSKHYAASLTTAASFAPTRIPALPTVGALSSPALRSRVARILSHKRLLSRGRSAGVVTGAVLVLASISCALAGLRLVDAAPAPDGIGATAMNPESGRRNRRAVQRASDHVWSPPAGGIDAAPRPARRVAASRPPAADSESGSSGPVAAADAADRPLPQPATVDAEFAPLAPLPSRTPSLTAIVVPAPVAPRSTADVRPGPFWEIAADGGVAVGKASQKAAVATAGFFSRFGKKVAASF